MNFKNVAQFMSCTDLAGLGPGIIFSVIIVAAIVSERKESDLTSKKPSMNSVNINYLDFLEMWTRPLVAAPSNVALLGRAARVCDYRT